MKSVICVPKSGFSLCCANAINSHDLPLPWKYQALYSAVCSHSANRLRQIKWNVYSSWTKQALNQMIWELMKWLIRLQVLWSFIFRSLFSYAYEVDYGISKVRIATILDWLMNFAWINFLGQHQNLSHYENNNLLNILSIMKWSKINYFSFELPKYCVLIECLSYGDIMWYVQIISVWWVST